MGWEYRGPHGPYYTRSRKVGGRVVREYIGAGEAGERAARRDATARRRRIRECAARRQQREGLMAAGRTAHAIINALDAEARRMLAAAGFYQHHAGEWRRRRRRIQEAQVEKQDKQSNQIRTTADIPKLLKRCHEGDKAALRELIARLSGNGLDEILGSHGLAAMAEDAWLDASFGDNHLRKALAAEQLRRMRVTLAGPEPSPLEQILVDKAVLCWFEALTADTIAATRAGELTRDQAEMLQKRQDRSHARFLSAIRTLAQVRKLGFPVLQVNVGEKQINIAGAVQIPEESSRGLALK